MSFVSQYINGKAVLVHNYYDKKPYSTDLIILKFTIQTREVSVPLPQWKEYPVPTKQGDR